MGQLTQAQIDAINEKAIARLAQEAIALKLVKNVQLDGGKYHISFDDTIGHVMLPDHTHYFLMGLLFYHHREEA
jgi:hypothetical protein